MSPLGWRQAAEPGDDGIDTALGRVAHELLAATRRR
jgi:hypothetical protein